MIDAFLCPTCKTNLEFGDKILSCLKCNKKYEICENFIDFADKQSFDFYNIPKLKLRELIEQVKRKGYLEAVNEFSKSNPSLTKYISDVKSADSVFHCLTGNNIRCLEIGSNLGNNVEILSKIFHDVYSLEWNDEEIEFQKIRFKENSINNVTIVKCKPLELPFPDDFFDLVICNGVVEIIGGTNTVHALNLQKKFLLELKRIIKNDGCICLGAENKTAINHVFKVDSPYRRFEKYKHRHGLHEYQKIFGKLGLMYESFWVLPSLYKPYFSSKINDRWATKWFYKNIDRFLMKEKQQTIKEKTFFLFGKMDKFVLGTLTNRFVPNLLFCCYKTQHFRSYEEIILKKIKYSSCLLMGRRFRLIFVLFDVTGFPKKMISLNRFGHEFPNEITKCERRVPNMKDPESRIWIEDWFPGSQMDPKNVNDVKMALQWLINFQKNSKIGFLTTNEKKDEVESFRNQISNFPPIDKEKYKKWLDDYEKFLLDNKLIKVARHGDFWYTNILVERKQDKTYVIDWENYSRDGNPFYDFLTFFLHLMTISSRNQIKSFKESLEMKGIFGEIIKNNKSMIEGHFGFNLDLVVLLRFFLIRNIIRSKIEGKKLEVYLQMLETLSNDSLKKLYLKKEEL